MTWAFFREVERRERLNSKALIKVEVVRSAGRYGTPIACCRTEREHGSFSNPSSSAYKQKAIASAVSMRVK